MTIPSDSFGQNQWLVDEMYRKFRHDPDSDPDSVDESWRAYFTDHRLMPTPPHVVPQIEEIYISDTGVATNQPA